MKNVKKLLKKAMVFAVAASMLVGTPLTASAAGIRGVYSVSDGTNDDIRGEGDTSHTGTVSNTNTSSQSGVLKDNEDSIIGIVLDKKYVNAEKGKKETLKATIIYGGDVTDAAKAELEKKIVWEVRNFDDSTAGANKKLSITVSAADRTKAELNPREGTVKGEDMVVSAKIDSSWYYDNGIVKKENVKGESFEATANVYIKEYSDSLELIGMPEVAYAKHTINLNTDEHLKRVPETANDDITWISTNTKAAKITAAGVVTFGTAGQSGKIIAVSEKGKKAEYEFTVDAGTPASKVVILDDEQLPAVPFTKNTTTVDLNSNIKGDWNGNTKDVTVQIYAKVKAAVDANGEIVTRVEDAAMSGAKYKFKNIDLEDNRDYVEVSKDAKSAVEKHLNVTDVIAWSSNKTAFAEVEAANTDSDDATLTAKGVGTATITAKASGGKKATLKVVVKATLGKLEITNEEPELYSGQSLQMTYDKEPAESKDAVVWSIAKVKNARGKEVKNPNATINAKGVLTIKPKLDLSVDDYRKVTVVLQSKKKLPNGEKDENGKDVTEYVRDEKEFDLTQSSIDEITVKDDKDILIAEVHIEGTNKVKTNTRIQPKSNNTTTINVPKNRIYDVAAVATTGLTIPNISDATTSTLTWKSSNTSVADFVNNGDSVKIIAKKKGTATMTVSGIRVTEKNGAVNKASVIKTTFKVNVLQPVNTITLNKPSVVLNEKTKTSRGNKTVLDQNVALKATLGPKGVNTKEPITWTVEKKAKGSDTYVSLGAAKNSKDKVITTASASVCLKAPVTGDEYRITARVSSGAFATATVKVVTKTTSVAIAKEADLTNDTKPVPVLFTKPAKNKTINNVTTAEIGDEIKMYPFVNIGKSTKVADVDWKTAGTETYEDVAYTVNKKGIVTIDSDGTVHVINSGTVTITAKTPLGKKATLKVEVSKP